LQNESSVALPRTAKARRTLTNKQGPVVEDADFDALLEAQRVEDLAIRAEEPTHFQKRKREVISDHDFQLRKDRTDNLLEGYRSVVLRRSARLRDKQLPEDYDPPPPALGRGEESDDDDPDLLMAGIQNRFEGLTILENKKKEGPTRVVLTIRQIRRIMAAKESLFKFGIFVPRSDREAQASPEAPRWRAGRDLEWLRLNEQGTFEGDWTWARVQKEHPTYKKSDIGYLFYVYDYKFSGEHRVRLVFDGSRQSADTFNETYAPTARQESVRIFHVICVEESYGIGQYDVPQAFLKAFIDFDIFVYPPKGQAAFDGQLLKLRRALYGGKQSAFLWFTLMNEFILELGFIPSPLDKCLYRRPDAVLILFCDDLRIGAKESILASLYASFYDKFGITTAPGTRFLGMDMHYESEKGILKMSMESYISTTMERFQNFDTKRGYPYRELVGCLLWISLCVMGPELLRVKDLARRSNDYTEMDYKEAFKVLKRVYGRKEYGIVISRGAAGSELVPSSTRQNAGSIVSEGVNPDSPPSHSDDIGTLLQVGENEVLHKTLLMARQVRPSSEYHVPDPDFIDIPRLILPVNHRYRLVVYADASFAIGENKQSVSGFVIYLNGVPILWGSLKQTIVVDSSCSAEFVAASIGCKQLLQAENMVGFFGFSCPKPYRFYTDSTACLHIATNPSRLGNVRHLQIRYHLVRCCVSLGDVEMVYCVTEEMIADLFTKLVMAAQDSRLTVRFYSLLPSMHGFVVSNIFE
jgi:hypothetical protein